MYATETYTVSNIDTNSYAMHRPTIKITPNLLFQYQCTSGKFIRLPNRIESNRNFFLPELECSSSWQATTVVSWGPIY